MKKKFITNLALLVVLNLLIKPFWVFGIDRTIQNITGAESYGLYFALFNFTLVINILLDMGITNFNNRNIAQNNQLLSKHFSNILVLRFLLGFVYLALSIFIAFVLGYNYQEFKLLLILVANQFLLSLIAYLRSNLSGLHLFKTDSLISVTDRLLMIIICSALLWGNVTNEKFKIEWFAMSQFAAYIITATITFFIVLSKSEFLKIKYDRNFLIVIIKQSLPYALLTLLMSFYYRIDSVMIERLLDDGKLQAGIYAQAFRILDAVAMFAFLFASLLLPMFAKLIKNNLDVMQLAKFSFLLLITPSLILAIGCWFYSQPIMDLLYHEHTSVSSPIFSVLMIGYVFIANSYIFGTLLTANGSIKQLNTMSAIGMGINIVLNIILIPHFKALGAAVAGLATQIFISVYQLFAVNKIFNFSFEKREIILFPVFIIVLVAMAYASVLFIESWFLGIVLYAVLALGLAIALKIIDVFSIIKLLKSSEI